MASVGESLQEDIARSARRPQTLVSSLGGFSNLGVSSKTIRSLQDLLITIQPLHLQLFKPENLPEQCKLGEGASYNVWKCLNRRSRELVAVKKIKLPRGNSNFEVFQSRVACVLKDIEVMNHPPLAGCENILNLLGYGWNAGEGSIPFLVTELAPGGTLRQFLLENPGLRGLQKIKLCRDVMNGLSELHLAGVIHGDLKLDNVLVVSGVQAKINDFSHSILKSAIANGSQEGIYRGTELYNPPEITSQYSVEWDSIDLIKCDVWALGLVCWEIMRGGTPFYEDPSISALLTECDAADSQSSPGSFRTPDSGGSTAEAVLKGLARIQPHLKSIAKHYAMNTGRLAIPDFSRLMLAKHLTSTLESDPQVRAADVSSLPLKFGVLTTYAEQGLLLAESCNDVSMWSFENFVTAKAAQIPFNAKSQIFSDFHRIASATISDQSTKAKASFHVSLSYITGFGVEESISSFGHWVATAAQYGSTAGALMLPYLNRTTGTVTNSKYNSIFTSLIRGLVKASTYTYDFTTLVKSPGSFPRAQMIHGVWGDDGETLLHLACRSGQSEAALLLLENFANPYAPDRNGVSPMHWLCMFPEDSDRAAIRESLTKKAVPKDWSVVFGISTTKSITLNQSLPIQLSGTPMSFAVAAGSLHTVTTLLELGEIPDAHSVEVAIRLHLDQILNELVSSPNGKQGSMAFMSSFKERGVDHALSKLCDGSRLERYLCHGHETPVAISKTFDVIAKTFELEDEQISEAYHRAAEYALKVADAQVAEVLCKRAVDYHYSPLHSKHLPVGLTQRWMSKAIPQSYSIALGLAAAHTASNNAFGTAFSAKLLKIAVDNGGSLNLASSAFHYQLPINIIIDAHRDDLLTVVLQLGASVKAKDGDGITPLGHLLKTGFLNDTRLNEFLSRGANMDEQDNAGKTLVHIAVEQDLAVELRILLQHEVNCSIKDHEFWTPLHHAVNLNLVEIVKILLQKDNLDIDSQDSDGNTPLAIAASKGRSEIIKLLLAANADQELRNNHGWTCLHCASHSFQLDSISTLFAYDGNRSHFSTDSLDADGLTPLALMLRSFYLQIIDKKPKMVRLTQGTQDDETDINETKVFQTTKIASIFLRAGAKSDIAFHWAVQSRYPPIIEEFLKHLPNLSLCDKNHFDGKTPVSLAAFIGDPATMERLLQIEMVKYGTAHLNRELNEKHRDQEGRSFLHTAVLGMLATPNSRGSDETPLFGESLLRILIQRGTSRCDKDIHGRTALHYAAMGWHCDPLIIDNFTIPLPPLTTGPQSSQIVELLIKEEPEVSLLTQDFYGFSSLDYAAMCLNVEALKVFLSSEPSLNRRKEPSHSSQLEQTLFLLLQGTLVHPMYQPALDLAFDLVDMKVNPFAFIKGEGTAFDLVAKLSAVGPRHFLRSSMLLQGKQSIYAKELEHLKLHTNEQWSELVKLMRRLALVSDFETKPQDENSDSTFRIWINDVQKNPKYYRENPCLFDTSVVQLFGLLLVKAGADVLAQSKSRQYAIESAIAQRAPFSITAWLFSEHIHGAQLEDSFKDPYKNDSLSLLKPLNLFETKTHDECLSASWKVAVKTGDYHVIDIFLRSSMKLNCSLLSLGVPLWPLRERPAIQLLQSVLHERNPKLLWAYVRAHSQGRRSVPELEHVWNVCTSFSCRISAVFDERAAAFATEIVAGAERQLVLRIEPFISTLPSPFTSEKDTRRGAMVKLIVEIDLCLSSQHPNYGRSNYSPNYLASEIAKVLIQFETERITDFAHEPHSSTSSALTIRDYILESASSIDRALRWSILNGYENIARFLRWSGASDIQDKDQRYVMHMAAICGRQISPELLNDLGTSPDVPDEQGKTTLHLAAEHGHVAVLERLLESIQKTEPPNRPRSASAHSKGEPQASTKLKSKSAGDNPSYTPFSQRLTVDETKTHKRMASLTSFAAWSRSADVSLPELITHRRDNGGRNALELAVIGGHVDATSLLLEKVYKYKIRDTEVNAKGESVAHLAAKHGHVAILQLLAKHDVNLNLLNAVGQSPLQVAFLERKTEAFTELNRHQRQIIASRVVGPSPRAKGNNKEIKLLVIGDENVGKTNLCITYTTNEYPSEYVPTVFDNYAVTVLIGDDKYTLGIFDTAGQEDYDRLRPLSYPQTDVFLLCFSNLSPRSFESILDKWFPEIHHHCPNVPFLLVGVTEVDGKEDKTMRDKMRENGDAPIDEAVGIMAARAIGAAKYVECNLLTQKGLKNVFDEAILVALNPPENQVKTREFRWKHKG